MSSAPSKKPKKSETAPPPPLVRARLVSKTGTSAGMSFVLSSDRPATVGRSRSATILLPNQLVSREHASIGFENGQFVLEHVSSTNSTMLNGEAAQRESLQHLDVIGFGPENEFIFLLERSAALEPVSQPIRQVVLLPAGGDDEPVRLGLGQAIVGRASGNTVILDQKAISSQHARIEIGPDRVDLEDLGSANGTAVNERRVDGKHKLADGDTIVFGKVVAFVVRIEREPPPATVPPASGWRLSAEEESLALPIPSEPGIYVLGRDVGCDLVLENKKSVSRRHAEIHMDGSGRLRVRDLASGNGTFVNGVKIRDAELQVGDRVQFGLVGFRVEARS